MMFDKEIETYKRELPGLLLRCEGQFIVISEGRIVRVCDAYEDALNSGYEKCGLTKFLVKRIEAVEQPRYFSRDLQCKLPISEGVPKSITQPNQDHATRNT